MSTALRVHPLTDLGSVLFGQTRLRVLGWLFSHPDEAFYLRQLVRRTGAAHGAVQRELNTLADAGLLQRTVDGRQVYFQANRESPIFPELQALLLKTTGVVDVVRRALEPLGEQIVTAFLFGSAARGELRKGSDIDLLVVGDISFARVVEALALAQDRLGREINPTVYPPSEFRAKLAEGHHFLTRVLLEPYVFVVGGADELDRQKTLRTSSIGETSLLPPGQTATLKFPLVGEQAPAPEALDLDRWELLVGGQVERPLRLSYSEVRALPQEELVADIHCVTSWSHFGMRLGGTRLALLLERARPRPEARFVRFEAYSERRHDTSLPLDLAFADTWLIHSRNGEPLSAEHGFPLRTVTPSRYFYKSLKWVHRIELLAEDRLGYWERESSYHNDADPWPGDQRFVSGSLPPEKLAALREAESFVPYRGPKKVILSADLRGWIPKTRDLSNLHLKNCDLRLAHLEGANLERANLSLSDLRGASLAGANLRGADLEGANLADADLSGADLRDTALSATKFFEFGEDGRRVGAKIEGMLWAGAREILEEQEAYLREAAG